MHPCGVYADLLKMIGRYKLYFVPEKLSSFLPKAIEITMSHGIEIQHTQ